MSFIGSIVRLNRSERNNLHDVHQAESLPALTDWNQNGPVDRWINLLEKYKRDSKFKWSHLKYLKLEGIKVGIDLKKRAPELYEVIVEVVDKMNVAYTDKDKLAVVNHSVVNLVHFLKQITQLVKDFRSIYKAAMSPTKLMNRLAKHNPKVFTIREAGSDQTRHSVTIKILNLLVATEADKDRNVAKWAVSTKVLHYMMQLSQIVNIKLTNNKKYGEMQRSLPHLTTRQLFGSLDLLSIQSEVFDLSKNEAEIDQMGGMFENLVHSRHQWPMGGQGDFEDKWSLFKDDRMAASDFHLDQLDV